MGIVDLGNEPMQQDLAAQLPKPYYAELKGENAADVEGAIEGLMRAYQGDPGLRERVIDYLWHESRQIEEQLFASKRTLPLDIAARQDEYVRGELSGLKRAMECLADQKHMEQTLEELKGQ